MDFATKRYEEKCNGQLAIDEITWEDREREKRERKRERERYI